MQPHLAAITLAGLEVIIPVVAVLGGISALIAWFLKMKDKLASKDEVSKAINECAKGRQSNCIEFMRGHFIDQRLYEAKHDVLETGLAALDQRMTDQMRLLMQVKSELDKLSQKIADFCNGKSHH